MKTFYEFMEGNFDKQLSGVEPWLLKDVDEMWEKLLPVSGLGRNASINAHIGDWVKMQLLRYLEEGDFVDEQDLVNLWNSVKDKIIKNYNDVDFLEKLQSPDFTDFDLKIMEDSDGVCKKVKLQPNQRLHYSKDSNLQIRDFGQQVVNDKPKGLWYACDEGWYDYCKHNFGGERNSSISNKYVITLDMSKIAVLNSEYKLQEFTHSYYDRSDSRKGYRTIDWKRVAEKYTGIECCPYFRELREYYLWYYGWDVPSGCVWNKSTILKIEKVD